MGTDFSLHRQFKPLSGYGPSRLPERHFAGLYPVSIGSVLQSIERLGAFFLEPFLHLGQCQS